MLLLRLLPLDHWQGIVVMGYCPIARAQKFGETVIKILAQSTLRADNSQCATWCWPPLSICCSAC